MALWLPPAAHRTHFFTATLDTHTLTSECATILTRYIFPLQIRNPVGLHPAKPVSLSVTRKSTQPTIPTASPSSTSVTKRQTVTMDPMNWDVVRISIFISSFLKVKEAIEHMHLVHWKYQKRHENRISFSFSHD